jgi:hypothetical protein
VFGVQRTQVAVLDELDVFDVIHGQHHSTARLKPGRRCR